MEKRVKFFIKLLLTATAIYIIYTKIDTKKLKDIIADADILYLFLAFIFFNLSKIVGSIRLNRYFRETKIKLSELKALRLYYIGMFYNLFLPTGLGGDGYKIYILNRRYNIRVSKLIPLFLLDRLSGLVPLLLFGAVLFLFSRFNQNIYFSYLAYSTIILSIPTLYLLNLYLFRDYINIFFITLSLGAVLQILQLISALFIVYAISYQNNLIEFLTLFLISSIVAVLPISIGGVGVRELTFLYGLNYIGLNSDVGVAFSILFFIITATSSIVGGVLKRI